MSSVDVERIAAWLGRRVEVEAQATSGSSNVTWYVTVDTTPAVLRHPPIGPTLPTAHDMSREHRFLVALAGTDVPVPAVLAHCDDRSVVGVPFLVTERMPGVCLLTQQPHGLDARQLALHAVDVLASLHALDWRSRALRGPSGNYLERQVHRWRDQLARTPTSLRLGDLDPIAQWLLDHLPTRQDVTIVHGDYGFHNLLVQAQRVCAVLDWELATIGDPLADVMGFLKGWGADAISPNPANEVVWSRPGAPSRDELLARYESRTGRVVGADRAFYDVWGLWRSIGVMEGIHARTAGRRFGDETLSLVARARAMIA
jgi:aminoglycoside phosphotransferase (APT) family kinase protein